MQDLVNDPDVQSNLLRISETLKKLNMVDLGQALDIQLEGATEIAEASHF